MGVFTGWPSARQRPAGSCERRVAAGMLQSRGHGDAPPIHVARRKPKRDDPAGGVKGFEGRYSLPSGSVQTRSLNLDQFPACHHFCFQLLSISFLLWTLFQFSVGLLLLIFKPYHPFFLYIYCVYIYILSLL